MYNAGGDTVRTIDDIEQPLLWIVPFAVLTLVTIVSLVNTVLKFLPNNSGYFLMLAASGFICASVAGFITELIKGRGKYVYMSMAVSVFIGSISFLVGYGFFKANIISGPAPAAIPAISELISNITLTLLPGSPTDIAGIARAFAIVEGGAAPDLVDLSCQNLEVK